MTQQPTKAPTPADIAEMQALLNQMEKWEHFTRCHLHGRAQAKLDAAAAILQNRQDRLMQEQGACRG